MQPEISKRCPECGASIRAQSAFCPQCGKDLNPSAPRANVPTETKEQERVRAEGTPSAPLMLSAPSNGDRNSGAIKGPLDAKPVEVERNEARVDERVDELDQDGKVSGSARSLEGDGARVKLNRARSAARDAMGERLSPRVEKLRQASTLVLDEAADDPSLRFVLIAVALFLLFLLLLFLSRVLG